MNIVIKHIIRLSNTIKRRIKIITLKLQYGSSFQAEKFHFRNGFSVFIEDSGVVKIGKNVFFNTNCSITARKSVVIGSNCIFGENVKIYDHNHRYKNRELLIKEQGYSSEEVVIEEDCWIGSNVTILKGVRIGRHSVVGAGVIVYKDLPENSVTICNQTSSTILI